MLDEAVVSTELDGVRMTVDQWIALGASVGAILAATATFFTILQMSKQRRSSYRPDLLFPTTYFFVNSREKSDAPFLGEWSASEEVEIGKSGILQIPLGPVSV